MLNSSINPVPALSVPFIFLSYLLRSLVRLLGRGRNRSPLSFWLHYGLLLFESNLPIPRDSPKSADKKGKDEILRFGDTYQVTPLSLSTSLDHARL